MTTIDEFTAGLKAIAEALGISGEPLKDYGWEQIAREARHLRIRWIETDQIADAAHELAENKNWYSDHPDELWSAERGLMEAIYKSNFDFAEFDGKDEWYEAFTTPKAQAQQEVQHGS